MVDILLVVFAWQSSGGMPEPVQAEVAWIAEGEFCEPETVLPLPDDTLLVSNVCDYRTEGDGYLTLLGPDGTVINSRQVEGLDSPLGMALVAGLLYIVDNNTVKVLHWPTYEQHATIPLQTSVANDVAVATDGTVYVTDTGRGEVAVVSPEGKHSLLIGEREFSGANGIHIEGKTLYVGGERLWRVGLKDNTVTTIGPDWLTDIDGIEMETDGTLQVTPVGGPLVRLVDGIKVIGGDGVSSANHGYAASLGLVLIPTGFDNSVIALKVLDRARLEE